MRIAVLDEDRCQAGLICQVLDSANHTCHPFANAKEMLVQLRRESYDMLIIHWQAPDLSSVEILRTVRERLSVEILRTVRERLTSTLPILFMTSHSSEDDIVAGLAAGADDYMIKPIRRGELVARVHALLRRAYPSQKTGETLQFGNYVFETRTNRLSMKDNTIELTQKEFDLALLLFRNIGRPLSRAYILEAVWSRDVEIPSRTMDTHVSRVRSKLQLRPENGYRLAPVYSYGYKLEQLAE
jgi:DNA-binding response OmpR family regulator